jgi:glycosyltransferase involved in cell wall biosynthesis
MKPISFIIPSRNNLKYLKWCYNSIRKNLGYIHEICIADDASVDGTWEWLQKISEKDIGVKIHKNEGPDRQGLVVLYDKLVKDYATNDIIMIFHADMYACPGLDEAVFKHLKKKTIVCATRVEPSLHPPGPEKIVSDYGIEPEEFDEMKFLSDLNKFRDKDKITHGVFAPWAIYKEDFWDVGGHDILFSPTSREDSDIFNRFKLNGCKFIQTWDGMVYHLTSRGSRFNSFSGGKPGKINSEEWQHTNNKNIRNFIRKWGTMVKHDDYMMPIVTPKYDIGFVVKNCTFEVLHTLEPWCSDFYGEFPKYMKEMYIRDEKLNTLYDLDKKIHDMQLIEKNNDILVEFDAKELDNQNFQYITQLQEILSNDEELDFGKFDLGIFTIMIHRVKTYEKELIVCER